MTDLEQRMRGRGVRPTAIRILILKTLERAARPMSQLDIETELETVDQSTVSRSVGTFAAAGLLHVIDDGSGVVKYEFCKDDSCHSGSDDDRHAHFHCQRCGRTECLYNVPVPMADLPEGYAAEGVNYVIYGLCQKCSAKEAPGDSRAM